MNVRIQWFWLGIVLTMSVACQKEQLVIERPDIEFGVERMSDVDIKYSDSAMIRVIVEGPTMLSHLDRQEPRQTFPDGVKVTFFDEQQQKTSILTAKYGIRLEHKAEVIVRDSVVWQSVDNRRLETEEMIWDERRQKVYTNRYVAVILPPADTSFHLGFEADQDFSNVKFKSTTGNKVVKDFSEGF